MFSTRNLVFDTFPSNRRARTGGCWGGSWRARMAMTALTGVAVLVLQMLEWSVKSWLALPPPAALHSLIVNHLQLNDTSAVVAPAGMSQPMLFVLGASLATLVLSTLLAMAAGEQPVCSASRTRCWACAFEWSLGLLVVTASYGAWVWFGNYALQLVSTNTMLVLLSSAPVLLMLWVSAVAWLRGRADSTTRAKLEELRRRFGYSYTSVFTVPAALCIFATCSTAALSVAYDIDFAGLTGYTTTALYVFGSVAAFVVFLATADMLLGKRVMRRRTGAPAAGARITATQRPQPHPVWSPRVLLAMVSLISVAIVLPLWAILESDVFVEVFVTGSVNSAYWDAGVQRRDNGSDSSVNGTHSSAYTNTSSSSASSSSSSASSGNDIDVNIMLVYLIGHSMLSALSAAALFEFLARTSATTTALLYLLQCPVFYALQRHDRGSAELPSALNAIGAVLCVALALLLLLLHFRKRLALERGGPQAAELLLDTLDGESDSASDGSSNVYVPLDLEEPALHQNDDNDDTDTNPFLRRFESRSDARGFAEMD